MLKFEEALIAAQRRQLLAVLIVAPTMRAVLLSLLGLHASLPARAGSCPPNAAPFNRPDALSEAEQVRYSDLYSVSYYNTYKVIKYVETKTLLKANWPGWPNPAQVGKSPPNIVLYECGTTPPSSSFPDVTEDAQFFSVPIERAALPWTGMLHFFEMLSLTEAIHAIDMTYASSPCMQLLEVCTPGIHAKSGTLTWKNAAAGADVVFSDSWGSGAINTSADVAFEVSTDSGLLHRAEWIRFVALFFNQEVLAGQIFAQVEADFLAMQAEAARLKAAASTRVPSIAWVAHQACSDVACDGKTPGQWAQKADGNWCRCGAFYLFYNSHARKDITELAGARLLPMPAAAAANCTFLTNSDGSQTYECNGLAQQHFLQHLSEADVIVDETTASAYLGPYDLDDFVLNFGTDAPGAPSLKAMLNEAVYRDDGSVSDPRDGTGEMGSSEFEQQNAQPQEILSDMMHAVWGGDFKGACPMRYMRNLYNRQPRDYQQHSDCPLHDAGGNHDCAGIHNYEHGIKMCAPRPETPSNTSNGDNGLALGLGLGLGLPLGLLVICGFAWLCFRSQKPTPTPASPMAGGQVVGFPVSDGASKAPV